MRLSRVGLGGYELGPEPNEQWDVPNAVRVLGAAIESGITWLDTSENYLATHNEELIGAALGQIDADDLLVASKVAPGAAITGGGSGFRREQVHAACRGSLERVGRDHLDLYFLHWPDDTGVPLEETWGAMGELVDAGLVRAIGLSNYVPDDVARCHAQRPVDAVQVGLSLLDYLDNRSAIAGWGDAGIAVTVYEPLGSGVLTGRTLEQVRASWTGPWIESDFYKRLLGPGRARRASQSPMRCGRSRSVSRQPSLRWRSRGCSTSPASPRRSRAAGVTRTRGRTPVPPSSRCRPTCSTSWRS
jgi:aryl-alcohol dehydrogenase-like predicted oxidoreductase